MIKDNKRTLILSLLTVSVMVAGLFATVISTSFTEMEPPEAEQSSQQVTAVELEERPCEIGEEPISEFEESGIEDEPPSIDYDEIIDHQIFAGEYEITEDDKGIHRIDMLTPGCGAIGSPGDPALPEKMLEFQVPDNIEWSTVELNVEIVDSAVLPGSYNIAPNPPFIAGDSEFEFWGYGKSIIDGKNMHVYNFDSNYPEDPVELLPYSQRKEPTQSGFEKAKYLRIAYRPFLYNPVAQELTLIQKVNIHINYEYLPDASRGTRGSTYDYVIITTNDIVANSEKLEYFINLKELTHDVLVVTEDDYDILTGQAPNERPEKIRQWLIDNEPTMGIDYVLLIGDPDPDDPSDPNDHVGDIPMKWCMPNYFGWRSRENPTDYFYAELDGNWDLDGDQFFGECLDVNHPESPDPMNVNTDYFSVRWTGFVHCDFDEEYEFHTFSDGGVRLYVGGDLIIDNWETFSEHPPTNDYALKNMTVGDHSITLEYKEHTGDAIIKLYWRTTVGDSDPNYLGRQIIPLDHLRNETDTADGLTGTYYNNVYMTGTPGLENPDGEVINFIWGTGDLGGGGPETGADVFIGRIPVYNDDYTKLDDILLKIIEYETDAGDISWRKTILLPMEPLWDDTPAYHLGEGIRNDYALAAGFTCFRIYEEDFSSSGGPTPELWPTNVNNVVNEWKNGYGMVVFDTHGSPTSASDIIGVDQVPQLDDTKPAFVYLVACTNAHPETPNNLAYSVLEHGGITTLGASRVSYGAHGAWTFDPTDATNHNLAYFYTKKVINDGSPKPAGEALYLTKGNVPNIGSNLLNYNLYGDPDCYLLSTVPNVPPTADAGGPYVVGEGTPVAFDASGSNDPDSYPAPLEYRWDFNGDGEWDTPWSTSPTATFTWTDDYAGTVVVEVSDSVLTDTDSTSVIVNNVAPSFTPLLSFSIDEAQLFTLITDPEDPGSDDITVTWELELGPTQTNTYYNDGVGPDPDLSWDSGIYPFSVIDSISHTYGDNGDYNLTLTVEDDDEGITVQTIVITVDNVDPSITHVEAYILVNFTLRAAGEKWHNVEMYIYENDLEIGFAEVVRYPGTPDDQSVTLYEVKCDVTKYINITVLYTPADDPVNGQPNGATPCWVNISFDDGGYNLLHNTFNVQHPETWEWNIGVNQFFIGHNITFESTAEDPGSDDLTFTWHWDDGTADDVHIYYNDGANPDPYPSPWGPYPVTVTDITKHAFSTNGNYDTTLTVEDDDGGSDVIPLVVILV